MLKPDFDRFKELAKNKHLSLDDFHSMDMDLLRDMARTIVPQLKVKEVNPITNQLETRDVPDFSGYPDELSLIRLLKHNNIL